MKEWIYRHGILFAALLFFPFFALFLFFLYRRMLDPFTVTLLSLWLLWLVMLPGRRAGQVLYRDAYLALYRDCDPFTYVEKMQFLSEKRSLPAARRLMLSTNLAVGADACGKTEDALRRCRECLDTAERENPAVRYVIYLTYACITAHSEAHRDELPHMIAQLEAGLSQIGQGAAERMQFRESIATIRDAHRLWTGEYDGLRKRFLDRLNAICDTPAQNYPKMLACIWLSRLYDRLGEYEKAGAMYRYVEENGYRLAIAREAKISGERCRRLAEEEKCAAPATGEPEAAAPEEPPAIF